MPSNSDCAEYVNRAHDAYKRNADKMPEDVQKAFRVVFMLAAHGMASYMLLETANELRELLPSGEISEGDFVKTVDKLIDDNKAN